MYRPADKARQIGDDFNKIRDFEPLPGRIYTAEFNHDGSQIVVGSSNDGKGEVRVYKTDDAKLLSKFDGQPGAVYSATFRPDGGAIAAGGFEGKVLLIGTGDGKLIKEFVPVPIVGVSVVHGR
jgi:WD40 repeat protein